MYKTNIHSKPLTLWKTYYFNIKLARSPLYCVLCVAEQADRCRGWQWSRGGLCGCCGCQAPWTPALLVLNHQLLHFTLLTYSHICHQVICYLHVDVVSWKKVNVCDHFDWNNQLEVFCETSKSDYLGMCGDNMVDIRGWWIMEKYHIFLLHQVGLSPQLHDYMINFMKAFHLIIICKYLSLKYFNFTETMINCF